MTTTPERRTATLSELVAEEIGAALGRRRWSQAQLARAIGKTQMWVSLRMRGIQPIDMNDLGLIANALEVGVHELMPSPEAAAGAAVYRPIPRWVGMTEQPPQIGRPPDNRPSGRPLAGAGAGVGRTGYLDRGGRRRRDR